MRTGKTLVDLKTYKTNWHRETGNTGINTLGKISGASVPLAVRQQIEQFMT
jgi:hypothetical protein